MRIGKPECHSMYSQAVLCGPAPIHPPGQTSGYYVTNNNDAY